MRSASFRTTVSELDAFYGFLFSRHDPSATKVAARRALTVKELRKQFIEEYSTPRNKPSTVETYQDHINRYIIPTLGRINASRCLI